MFESLGELAVDVSLTRGDKEAGSTLMQHFDVNRFLALIEHVAFNNRLQPPRGTQT